MKINSISRNRRLGISISFILVTILTLCYTSTNLLTDLDDDFYNFLFYLKYTPSIIRTLDNPPFIKCYRDGINVPCKKGSHTIITPNPEANKHIIFLYIDERSIEEYKLQELSFKPYIYLLNFFINADISSIYFSGFHEITDKLEPPTFTLKNEIHTLSNLIKNNDKVVSDYFINTYNQESINTNQNLVFSNIKQLLKHSFENKDSKIVDKKSNITYQLHLPPQDLLRNLSGIGFSNHDFNYKENNKFPLYIKWKDRYYPSIVLILAMRAYNLTLNDIEIVPGKHIKLKNINVNKLENRRIFNDDNDYKKNQKISIEIPIDENGCMYINYIGNIFDFSNYESIFFMNESPQEFSGYIGETTVFVLPYFKWKEFHIASSPLGNLLYVEHIANALNTILNQSFVQKTSKLFNVIIFLMVLFFLGLIIPGKNLVIITIIVFLLLTSLFVSSVYFFLRIPVLTCR